MHQTRQEILQALAPLSPQTLEEVDGNLLLLANDLHIGFFGYGYPLLQQTDSVENVPVAAMVDIGLMKEAQKLGQAWFGDQETP